MGIPVTKKIYDFRFYFKKDSVIMEYRQQYVCFNSFGIRNKRNLEKFSESIRSNRKPTLDTVFGYAREYDVPSMSLTDGSAVKRNLERIN